jgi:hypothetical protein
MNRGGVGARSLNIELQAVLNPAGERKVERFGWTFAPGDKLSGIIKYLTQWRSVVIRSIFLACHRSTMASSREVIMTMQRDNKKHSLWNSLSNNAPAQLIIGAVVVVILIALAAKYVW